MKFRILFPLLAFTVLSACHEKKEQAATSNKFVLSDSMQKMITIDTATICNISDELILSGEVGFNENNMVKIFPRSSGQVVSSTLSLGDRVTKGQVLAIIKSADVAGSYSDLSGANADVAIAKRQMENAQSLYTNGISSERDYIEAKQNYEKALASRQKVQSVININGGGRTDANGQYIITSPIDGYIVEKKISTGAFIRQDMTDNLFTISDLKNVWIYANVYEADINKIKEGLPVQVKPMAYPDKSYTGKVNMISQVLDPQSKAMRVRITLENKDMVLKPDMFTKVIISNQEGAKAICIPTSALISQDGKNFVVVYKAKDNISIAEVNIIKTVNDHTYIQSGVEPGTPVVTKYQNLIFSQLSDQ